VRLALPQPWEEVPHTADLGIAARGATPEEALARLVLALGALLRSEEHTSELQSLAKL
jgi:SHS2 domain-containing protein